MALEKAFDFKIVRAVEIERALTKDEIQAVLHQVTIYCGVPVGVECFRIARKVFAARSGDGKSGRLHFVKNSLPGITSDPPMNAASTGLPLADAQRATVSAVSNGLVIAWGVRITMIASI